MGRVAVQLLAPAVAAVQRAAADAAGGGTTVLDPPHVSLGWPWAAEPTAPEIPCARVAPIAVRLERVQRFAPGGRGAVLHLPLPDEAAERVRDLAWRLGWDGELTPHLSLIRHADDASLERAADAVRAELPLRVELAAVQVSAEADGAWTVVAAHPLEGPADPETHRMIKGRRWRVTEPGIPERLRQALVDELMAARRAVKTAGDDEVAERAARDRVQDAKVALGERGPRWWQPSDRDGLAERVGCAARALARSFGRAAEAAEVARVAGVTPDVARASGRDRGLDRA